MHGKGGKRPRMDWFGLNPFEPRYPRLKRKPRKNQRGLSDIDTIWREIRTAYSDKNEKKKGRRGAKKSGKGGKVRRPKRLWLSEWLVPSDHAGVFDWFVSRDEQALWLTAGYREAAKKRYVQGLGWYRLDDYPEKPGSATWGLTTYDGARKPAYAAYAAVP
jgi:hypothetical protein